MSTLSLIKQNLFGEGFVCVFSVDGYVLYMCRYGKPGCDAETCDYFLSYRRIGTDVEYEMSADTDGWVAVGFSSDKKMVRSCATPAIASPVCKCSYSYSYLLY